MKLTNIFSRKKTKDTIIDFQNLPTHIGIIMDGNGRWARKRGLPRSVGHKSGASTLKTITEYADGIGIKHITVYAFSTENWKRPEEEVNALMVLLEDYLDESLRDADKNNIRIKFIGHKEMLTEVLIDKMSTVEGITENKTGTNLNIAINYGGRDEILHGIKKLVQEHPDSNWIQENLNEDIFHQYLYNPELPDVDLIIRPSGEMRLSNFLLWESAYAEYYFDDVLWPDYNQKHFVKAIVAYQQRNRRFGGI